MKFLKFLVLAGLLAPVVGASSDGGVPQPSEIDPRCVALYERLDALVIRGERSYENINPYFFEGSSVINDQSLSFEQKEAALAKIEARARFLAEKTVEFNAFIKKIRTAERNLAGASYRLTPVQEALQAFDSSRSAYFYAIACRDYQEILDKRLHERYSLLSSACKTDAERLLLASGIAQGLADELAAEQAKPPVHSDDGFTLALDVFFQSQKLSEAESSQTALQKLTLLLPEPLKSKCAGKSAADVVPLVNEFLEIFECVQERQKQLRGIISPSERVFGLVPIEHYDGIEADADELQRQYEQCSSVKDYEAWVKKADRVFRLSRKFSDYQRRKGCVQGDQYGLFALTASTSAAASDGSYSVAQMKKYVEAYEVAQEKVDKIWAVFDRDTACVEFLFGKLREIYLKTDSSSFSGDDARGSLDPQALAVLDSQRDILLEKACQAFEKNTEKEGLNELADQLLLDFRAPPGFRKRTLSTFFGCDVALLLASSKKQREDWIQRAVDIDAMIEAIADAMRRKDGIRVNDSLSSDSAENKEFEKIKQGSKATSVTPEERSVEIAKSLMVFARENGIEKDVTMPQWTQNKKTGIVGGLTNAASSAFSSSGSLLYRHSLVAGFGAGVVLAGLSALASALSYDENNPPVDEDGNVISKQAYVWKRLKKFDPKTIECWLKVGAIAAVVAGIGVKGFASQTPVAP